jgi:hypothetical protein
MQIPKRIPIAAARDLATQYDLRQVVLMAWDGKLTHVVTYGRTVVECDQAAQGGDLMKKAMGWPEKHLGQLPSRVKALQRRVRELEAENATLKRQQHDLVCFVCEQNRASEGHGRFVCMPCASHVGSGNRRQG